MWAWERGEGHGNRAVSQGWSRPQYSSWSSCWCSSISSSSGGANPSWRAEGRQEVSQAGRLRVRTPEGSLGARAQVPVLLALLTPCETLGW